MHKSEIESPLPLLLPSQLRPSLWERKGLASISWEQWTDQNRKKKGEELVHGTEGKWGGWEEWDRT